MRKYRKVITTEKDGTQRYYAQKRYFTIDGLRMCEYLPARGVERIRFETEADADAYIQKLETQDYERDQKRIVKTEYKKV